MPAISPVPAVDAALSDHGIGYERVGLVGAFARTRDVFSEGGNNMTLRAPESTAPVQTKRSIWLALLPCAALLIASTMLGGCVVEPGGHGWGWHHHDDR
jgi:hypothetical protein